MYPYRKFSHSLTVLPLLSDSPQYHTNIDTNLCSIPLRPLNALPSPIIMPRTKQTARMSTGSKALRPRSAPYIKSESSATQAANSIVTSPSPEPPETKQTRESTTPPDRKYSLHLQLARELTAKAIQDEDLTIEDSAVDTLRTFGEEYIIRLLQFAGICALDADRLIVQAQDVHLACKRLKDGQNRIDAKPLIVQEKAE